MNTTARTRTHVIVPAAVAALAIGATMVVASTQAADAATPTTHSQTVAAQSQTVTHSPKKMLDAWLNVWNGDFSQAPDIISPDFTVHAAMLDGGDGSAVHGVDGLEAMVGQLRGAFPDLHFTMQVDPLFDAHHASVRWTATGTYAGGFPGATAQPGTVVTFTGTDTLRIENGKFVEYWFNADQLQLLTQLRAL